MAEASGSTDALRRNMRELLDRLRHTASVQRRLVDQSIIDCEMLLRQLGGAVAESDSLLFLRPSALYESIKVAHLLEPESGAFFGENLKVFHEAKDGVYSLSQHPRTDPDARNPFEIVFESYDFGGDYFSLVLSAADDATLKLNTSSRFWIVLRAKASEPVSCYLRVNFKFDDRSETIVNHVKLWKDPMTIEFDLNDVDAPWEEVRGMWVDLILREAANTTVRISDFSIMQI